MNASATPSRAAWRGFLAMAALLPLLVACSDYDEADFSVRRQPTPLQVNLPLAATSAGAGWAHSCAILSDGSMQCWGANSFGQLGNGGAGVACREGYSLCSNGPVAVSSPPASFTQVRGGLRSTCAIDNAQAAHCWGQGTDGQLGQGARTSSDVPVAVTGGLGFDTLGGQIGADLFCGITTGDELNCWGAGFRGQPGDGSVTKITATPYRVGPTQTFSATAVGELHACALDAGTGAAFCWGENGFGQVGDGTLTDRTVPTATLGGQAYTQITAGLYHTCALDGSGTAFCWGAAEQVGRATTSDTERATPTAVAGGQAFVAIAAGAWHTCALQAGGELFCWGDNSASQFGDGGTTSSLEPVQVTGVPLFAQLIAGGGHTCGITGAGEVFCWGANSYGQSGQLPPN